MHQDNQTHSFNNVINLFQTRHRFYAMSYSTVIAEQRVVVYLGIATKTWTGTFAFRRIQHRCVPWLEGRPGASHNYDKSLNDNTTYVGWTLALPYQVDRNSTNYAWLVVASAPVSQPAEPSQPEKVA